MPHARTIVFVTHLAAVEITRFGTTSTRFLYFFFFPAESADATPSSEVDPAAAESAAVRATVRSVRFLKFWFFQQRNPVGPSPPSVSSSAAPFNFCFCQLLFFFWNFVCWHLVGSGWLITAPFPLREPNRVSESCEPALSAFLEQRKDQTYRRV